MKVIIAGSRSFTDEDIVNRLITMGLSHLDVVEPEIVSGGAQGVDRIAERYADVNVYKLTVFPADWEQYGTSAGPRRNEQMAEYADALIYIKWSSNTPGTEDMIRRMVKKGKPVWGVTFDT